MTEPQSSAQDAVPDKRSFAALRHPGFRWYFIGNALAMMADSVEHVISYDVMWDKFQSQELQGFAIISHWVPFLLFSVYAGALADRFDPRRVIQAGMVLFIIATLGWGFLILTDSLQMWHAMVLLIIHGLAGVLWGPPGQMLIHDIVEPAQLQSGVRLLATSRTLGVLMGPAIGGGLLWLFGHAWGLVINAVIYIPLVIWCWKAPYGPAFYPPEKQRKKSAMRGLADIMEAIRSVIGSRTMTSMILLAGGASFFVGNAYQALMPEFTDVLVPVARDVLSGNTLQYVALFGASAAGALTAGLVLESKSLLRARIRSAFILLFLWCICMASFAVSTVYTVSLALLFIAGFLDLSYNAMAQTLVQMHAPAEARGKIIGLYSMSALGFKSFSGITVGIAGGIIGIQWSLGLSAAALFAFAIGLAVYAMSIPVTEATSGE